MIDPDLVAGKSRCAHRCGQRPSAAGVLRAQVIAHDSQSRRRVPEGSVLTPPGLEGLRVPSAPTPPAGQPGHVARRVYAMQQARHQVMTPSQRLLRWETRTCLGPPWRRCSVATPRSTAPRAPVEILELAAGPGDPVPAVRRRLGVWFGITLSQVDGGGTSTQCPRGGARGRRDRRRYSIRRRDGKRSRCAACGKARSLIRSFTSVSGHDPRPMQP